LQVSSEVIDNIKVAGAGWQARMDPVIVECMHNHSTGVAKGPNIKIEKTGPEVIGTFKVSAASDLER
jgi:hypothetical protein